LRAAYKKDPTEYAVNIHVQGLDAGTSAGEDVRAFKIALARLKSSPDMGRLVIRESGPLPVNSELLDRFASVYRRGMDEVAALLKKVSSE